MVRGPAALPLEAVAMLSMALPIALVGLMHSTSWRSRLLYGLAACLLLAAVFATYRKSALLAPISVVGTVAYFRRRELLRLAPLAFVLIIVIHIAAPGALGKTTTQFDPTRLGVTTVSDRAADYDAVRPDLWTHLLFGRGCAAQFLPFDEASNAGDEVGLLAIAGVHDHFVLGVAHRLEHSLHEIHDVLRVRIVVDQADQERLAERESTRLRIRYVSELVDHRLDACAGFLLHQRRLVDDPRNGFFRNAGESRDVIDGRVASGLQSGGSAGGDLGRSGRLRCDSRSGGFFPRACHGLGIVRKDCPQGRHVT